MGELGALVEIRRYPDRETLVFAATSELDGETVEVDIMSLPLPLEAYTAFQTVPVIEVE